MPAPRSWTDADNAYLRKVWTDPKVHRDDIAKRLGKTIDTIRMQAARLSLGGRPRGERKDAWPQAVADRAETLWKEGKSAAEIAKMISTKDRTYTRMAVIAFANREGIARHEPKQSNTNGRKTLAKLAASEKPKPVLKLGQGNVVFVQSPPVPPVSPARAAAFKPLEGTTPVPWTERGTGCAWPVGHDALGETLSCGAEKEQGSYCAEHQRMCGVPTGSTKELVRGLRKYT